MLLHEFALPFFLGILVGGLGTYGLLVYMSALEENKKLRHEQIKGVELWERLSQTEQKGNEQKPTK